MNLLVSSDEELISLFQSGNNEALLFFYTAMPTRLNILFVKSYPVLKKLKMFFKIYPFISVLN